jgi:hypothetical protein
MREYVDILYRLARFLAGVPPELLGALLIVVLWHPATLVAPFVYMVNLLSGEIAVLLLVSLWTWIIRPRLPSKVRNAIVRVRGFFLPAPVSSSADDLSKKNAALEARVDDLGRRLKVLESTAQGNPSDPPREPTGEDDRNP